MIVIEYYNDNVFYVNGEYFEDPEHFIIAEERHAEINKLLWYKKADESILANDI